MERKVYSKPTIAVVELRPEERIAASLDQAHRCKDETPDSVGSPVPEELVEPTEELESL